MLVDKSKGLEQFATPRNLFIFWSAFVVGLLLTLMASTDLFSHLPKGMGPLWIMQGAAFIAVFKFTLFYLKVRRSH